MGGGGTRTRSLRAEPVGVGVVGRDGSAPASFPALTIQPDAGASCSLARHSIQSIGPRDPRQLVGSKVKSPYL